MAEGQTYNIPETQLDWFRQKIQTLGKKSIKLVGEKVYCTVIGYHYMDGEGHKKLQKMKIFEVFVAHPDVKLNGWQFVARIDHSQDIGNVIRVVPGQALPERYRESAPVCEHCNINRKRRDTFVLTCADTSKSKQVGSSCLKDFLGHNGAAKFAELAEMLAIVGDYARGVGFERSGMLNDYRWVSSRHYMAVAAKCVLQHGWISAKFAKEQAIQSTSSRAFDTLHSDFGDPSAECYTLADRALEWVHAFGENGVSLNDWEHNCKVIAQSDALEDRHLGIAASIVGVYWSKFVKDHSVKKVSNFVGTENTKITAKVVLKTAINGEFSCRHVFEDSDGNVLIWFASGTNLAKDGLLGKEFTITATLKKHQIYNGVKQNLVNRVKVNTQVNS